MTSNLQIKIYFAGHRGMVGSAIVRNLNAKGFMSIVTRTHAELDLINKAAVNDFFETEKPDQVYLAAAKVGGFYATTLPRRVHLSKPDNGGQHHPSGLCPWSEKTFVYRFKLYLPQARAPVHE